MRLTAANIPIAITVIVDGNAHDVSGATVKQIKFRSPSGTEYTKSAVFATDGSDGVVQFLSVADFPDEVGTWEYEAYIEDNGQTYHTDIVKFVVGDIIAG